MYLATERYLVKKFQYRFKRIFQSILEEEKDCLQKLTYFSYNNDKGQVVL